MTMIVDDASFQVSTMDRFLLEVVIATNKMEVSLKTSNVKISKQFMLHYLESIHEYINA